MRAQVPARQPGPRRHGALLIGFVLALVAPTATLLTASPGHTASRVTVTNEFGQNRADPTYATELTLRGRGFQAIKNGHGGIYVFFGTVSGRWRPSQGGVTGKDYLYVPDAESKNNQGYQKFIAFQGSDTAGAAHGTIKADGSWSTTIKVPGATFQAVDRDGKVASVDCRKVKCGIITIGAHGVKNATNESFTPVTFADLYDAPPAGQQSSSGTAPSGDSATAPPTTAPGSKDADGKSADAVDDAAGAPAAGGGPATAVVDPGTAVVGRVLSFSGTGFRPGEQVTVSFDQGKAALGPLSAGASGEVAGVLQIPAGSRPGTHSLRLRGAASGAVADLNFPVTAEDTEPAAADAEAGGLPGWAAWAFLGLALALLAGAGLFAARRLPAIRTRRRVRGASRPTATETAADHAAKGPVHAS